jgi:hypothetical protein
VRKPRINAGDIGVFEDLIRVQHSMSVLPWAAMAV